MIYRLLRFFFRLYLRLFHLVEVRGAEHIPATGPVILCANHSSYLDSMLVAVCTERPVRFLIHHAFYRHPLLGFFVRSCGAVPITQGRSDKEAMRRAALLLEQGEVLGIFPEGGLTRTGLPVPGKPGAALLAATVGAPIVPITITGAFFAYPKGEKIPRPGTITVKVHPPLPVDPVRRREKGYLQEVTDAVMERVSRGLTPALRARQRKESRMNRPLPLSWYEYLPAAVALAVFLVGLLHGGDDTGLLLVTGLIALLLPPWLALARRRPQRGWLGFFRHFLPLLLLFPLYFCLVRLFPPAGPAGNTLHFRFVQGAVIAYLFALLAYSFLKNFAGFRRLSLGIQATSYLAFLPPLLLPFLPVGPVAPLLVTLMTFLLLHDILYRQPSLIASFLILAVLKVVAGLAQPVDPVAEGVALLIPAVVLAGLKVSGFPRR